MKTLDELRAGVKGVLTAAEVAPLLGISTRTVHRLQDAGRLPELWLGRKRMVPVPALLEMLGAGTANGDGPGHRYPGPSKLSDVHPTTRDHRRDEHIRHAP